jgi:hypothetical protein
MTPNERVASQLHLDVFRAERMTETIDRLQQHVAPVWR